MVFEIVWRRDNNLRLRGPFLFQQLQFFSFGFFSCIATLIGRKNEQNKSPMLDFIEKKIITKLKLMFEKREKTKEKMREANPISENQLAG